MHTRDQSFFTSGDMSPMRIAARPASPAGDTPDAGAIEYASWMHHIRANDTPRVDRSVIEFFCPDRLGTDAAGTPGA